MNAEIHGIATVEDTQDFTGTASTSQDQMIPQSARDGAGCGTVDTQRSGGSDLFYALFGLAYNVASSVVSFLSEQARSMAAAIASFTGFAEDESETYGWGGDSGHRLGSLEEQETVVRPGLRRGRRPLRPWGLASQALREMKDVEAVVEEAEAGVKDGAGSTLAPPQLALPQASAAACAAAAAALARAANANAARISEEGAPAAPATAAPASAEDASTEDASTEDASTEDASADDASEEDASAEAVSTEAVSTEAVSTEDASSEEAAPAAPSVPYVHSTASTIKNASKEKVISDAASSDSCLKTVDLPSVIALIPTNPPSTTLLSEDSENGKVTVGTLPTKDSLDIIYSTAERTEKTVEKPTSSSCHSSLNTGNNPSTGQLAEDTNNQSEETDVLT